MRLRRSLITRGIARLVAVGFWGAALVAAIFLWRGQERGILVPAVARTEAHAVAASVAGRIETLATFEHADVARGQILAILDDSALQVDLARARAELAQLSGVVEREEALLARQAAERASDEAADLRRFVRDHERERIAVLELAAELAADRIRLTGLELVLARSKGLASGRVGTVARHEDAQVAYDTLAASIVEREALQEAQEARVATALERLTAFRARLGADRVTEDSLLRPARAALRVQELLMASVQLQLAALVLRAPVAGRVADLRLAEGAFVAAGEGICTIHVTPAREVLAYAPDVALRRCRVGARVLVRRRSAPNDVFEASIASLGPSQVVLPSRFALDPRRPTFALPLRIRLPEGFTAVPGEAFDVFLRALE